VGEVVEEERRSTIERGEGSENFWRRELANFWLDRGGERFTRKAMERNKLRVTQGRHLAIQQRLDPHIEWCIEDARAETADEIEDHTRDRIAGVTLSLQLLDVRRERADRQFPRCSRGREPSIPALISGQRLQPNVRQLMSFRCADHRGGGAGR
jgi:hypothetical protein